MALRGFPSLSPDSIAKQEETPAQSHSGVNAARIWTGDEMRLLHERLVRQMSLPEIQDNLSGTSAEQVDNMR
jgi:hypothetical protein